MNLNKYQELASRTIPCEKEKIERIKEFVTGLCEESGEVAGVLKKVIYHNHPMTDEKEINLVKELGDVLWHVSALATEYGMNLEEIASINIAKLQKRYPEGFTNERSVNRNG